MNLRPYQEKIIQDTCEALNHKMRQLIVLPTGSGKTVIFSHILGKMNLRSLILAHTNELVEQAKNTLSKTVKKQIYEVSTVQKISNMKNLNKFSGKEFDLIIFDECHRAGANSYKKIIDKFSHAKILGVTATPFRTDGQNIDHIFGKSICSISILDMIREGFLCDFEGYRVMTGISLRGISTVRGDFVSTKLSSIINVKNRNSLIVREYLNICPKDKALAFTANIEHCDELANEFRNNGITCQSIHGNLSLSKRAKYLQDFKSGRIQVLTNCQVLTEGFDEPSIQCLLMARPTTSKTLYMQMLGRGSRIYPGKTACKVIEYTDNEYDICSLEQIIDSRVTTYRLKNGEKLSELSDRIPKILEDEAHETTVQKINIIPSNPSNNIYEKMASEWQKSFLRSQGMQVEENLMELEANNLILRFSSEQI